MVHHRCLCRMILQAMYQHLCKVRSCVLSIQKAFDSKFSRRFLKNQRFIYGLILMNVTPSPRLSEFQIGSSERLHLPSVHVLSCPKGSPRGQGNPTLPATSMEKFQLEETYCFFYILLCILINTTTSIIIITVVLLSSSCL